jgi:ATP-binding cassette subfamily B protein
LTLPPPPPLPDPPKRIPLRDRVFGSFSNAPRSAALLWRASPAGAVGMAAFGLAQAGFPVAMAWVAKLVIDALVAAMGMPEGPERDAATSRLTLLIGVEFGLVAAQLLISHASRLLQVFVNTRLGQFIRIQLLERAIVLDLKHFEDAEFYDRLTRARREAGSRPIEVVSSFVMIGSSLLTLITFTAVLLAFSPWVALAMVLASIPPFILEKRFADKTFNVMYRRSPESRRLGYLEQVMTTDVHAKELRVFRLGSAMLDRFKSLGSKFIDEDLQLAYSRARWAFPLSLVSSITFYACYLAVALTAVAGAITLGDVTFYIAAFRNARGGIETVLSMLNRLYESNLYMANLFSFLDLPATERQRTVPPGLPARAPTGIDFENVGFRYPTGNWAVRDLSFEIPGGSSLALVGKNGAGKTTVIKLLTRLYDPTEGRILLDGRDLQDYDEAELRTRIGAIFQDFNKYQFVLRENVGVGSIAHMTDESRVSAAVESAGAADVVASLAQGLDTQVGTWFPGGVELSGGQWQKVALARAFMREQADILILDEPTAALDAEAEHAVFERFRELSRGKTTVLISHRFASVRSADRILVLDEGRLIEGGTHAELVAAGGRYAQLFALQAAGYR